MDLSITVDGTSYDFASIAQVSNRDAMALEAAIGVTFENFMKTLGRRFAEIGKAVQAAKIAAPEGADPDLSEVDMSISARDMTAIVFLARRRAGERDLKFDDVEFTLAECRFGGDGDPDDPEAPDPDVDPTAGSSGPTPGPSVGPSTSNA